jgi:hypothetical protein
LWQDSGHASTSPSWDAIVASSQGATVLQRSIGRRRRSRGARPRARPGWGAYTGRPAIAGLVAGAIGGALGSLIGGGLQSQFKGQADPVAFLLPVAIMLAALVGSWQSLNLGAYGKAAARFIVGRGVGAVVAGIALVVGTLIVSFFDPDDGTREVGLVASLWSLTGALLGASLGVMRSARAGVRGAPAGALGGLLHGLDVVFENNVIIEGADPIAAGTCFSSSSGKSATSYPSSRSTPGRPGHPGPRCTW